MLLYAGVRTISTALYLFRGRYAKLVSVVKDNGLFGTLIAGYVVIGNCSSRAVEVRKLEMVFNKPPAFFGHDMYRYLDTNLRYGIRFDFRPYHL